MPRGTIYIVHVLGRQLVVQAKNRTEAKRIAAERLKESEPQLPSVSYLIANAAAFKEYRGFMP